MDIGGGNPAQVDIRLKGLFTPEGRSKLAHMLVWGSEPVQPFIRLIFDSGAPPASVPLAHAPEVIESRIIRVLERMAEQLEPIKPE